MKKILSSVLLLVVLCVPSWAALSDNLISYWALDETSGTRADKVAASANTLADNATVTSNPGKVYANAGQFTQVNTEYLSCPDATCTTLSVGGTAFTFIAFVYLDSTAADGIITKDDASTNREYSLRYTSSRFTFSTWTASGGSGVATVAANTFGVAATATWYMVTITSDQTNNKISVNAGTQDSVAATNAGWNGAAEFRIGTRTGSTYWNGRIGPVIFWKRALSAAEITTVYNNGAGLTYEGVLGTGIIMHPLTSGSDTTSSGMAGAPFTTASVSVSANSLIILAYLNAKDAGLSATTAVAGLGGTWVEIDHSSYHTAATPTRKVSLFRTMIGTTQTGTVTITHDSSQDGAAWSLVEFTGVQTGGTNGSAAVVQEKGASGGSGSTQVTCTLDNSFSDSVNNVAFGVFGRSATGGITPGTGFIEIHDATFTTPSNGIQTEYRKGEDLSIDATWSGGTDCGCQAIEVKALAAAGTNPFVILEDDDE